MFSVPSGPTIAFAQAVVISVALLAWGWLVARALWRNLGPVLHLGLAFPLVALNVALLMVLHLIFGGAVFSSPWFVRLWMLGTATIAASFVWRDERAQAERIPVLLALALVALAWAVWAGPLTGSLPVPHKGDTDLHLGWAQQLINGDPLPTTALIGSIPNQYPWLFHAFLAFVANLLPGARAMYGLLAFQLVLTAGVGLALFALGREMTRSIAGAAASCLFGVASGGFGFFLAREPAVILYTHRKTEGFLRYMGDLVFERTYNSSVFNLAPVFPRDLGLALLYGFLLLLAVGIVRNNRPLLIVAGFVLGLVGLAGAETFFVGLAVAVGINVFPRQTGRVRTLLSLTVPALALYALWAVPLVVNYLGLEGFRNLGVGLIAFPPEAILVSWGVVTPFALLGALRLRRVWDEARMQVAVAMVASAAALLLVATLVPKVLDRPFETLGFQHRYWPLLHVGLVLAAGFGAAQIAEWLRDKRVVATAMVVATTALAVPSPILASIALPRELEMPTVLQTSLEGSETALSEIASGGSQCNLAVPDRLSRKVFSYTGHQMVFYSFWLQGNNRAFIRWRELPGPPQSKRIRDNDVLLAGTPVDRWSQLARAYDVDLIVTRTFEAVPAFRSVPVRVAGWEGETLGLARVGECKET